MAFRRAAFAASRAARAAAMSPASAAGARKAASALAGALLAGGAATATAACGGWSWGWGPSSNVNGVDYQKVYADIAAVLDDLDHDDGSWGPVFVRLAWHAAGTYSKHDKTGGSDGSTMRYGKEAGWGANAGLGLARKRLEAVKAAHPSVSYADLWSLAGVVAIQEMGGPVIPWRPGRSDAADDSSTPPDGRLPDATKGSDHLRDVFHRMGFSDRDIVALSGAHALGRCHTDRSGFVGPWSFSPTTFSNEYFKLLKSESWVVKKEHTDPATGKTSAWKGPLQYTDAKTGTLMMLPTDLALTKDAAFAPVVDAYAADKAAFFADFTAAFVKLQENGVKAFAAAGAPAPLTLARAV